MSSKPVILFFQFDLMSHFFRTLKVAIALKDDYEVYIQESEKYATWLKESGVKSFKCTDLDAETALKKTGEFDFSWLNATDLEKIFLAQVDVIKKYKPVLVVGDTSFSLKMASEATSTPYFSIMNGYSTRYYEYTRTLSSTHPIAPFISWLPKRILDPMVKMGEKISFLSLLKPFQKVRSKYNLSQSTHYLEELTGDQNLICDLPVLFPQKNLPDNYRFLGPLFHENKQNGDAVLDELDSTKKTILVTMGSSKEWERFQFLNESTFEKYNVIVIGEENNLLHADFILKPTFVNFDEVMPMVDLMICHGGNGSIYQALSNKVPVLCYPSHVEQNWNVDRVAALGYGQSLEKVHSKHYPQLIEEWINKKNTINWSLPFEDYTFDNQRTLLLNLTRNIIQQQ